MQVSTTPPMEGMGAFIELDGHHGSQDIVEPVTSKITLPAAYASVVAVIASPEPAWP
jgi:hypothetical protein